FVAIFLLPVVLFPFLSRFALSALIQYRWGWHCTCGAVHIALSKMTIDEVVLSENDVFTLKIPTAEINWQTKTIVLTKPSLQLLEKIRPEPLDFGSWQLVATQGSLIASQMTTSQLEFTSKTDAAPDRLCLAWDDGAIEIIIQTDSIKMVCEHLPLHHVQRFLPTFVSTGVLDGEFVIADHGQTKGQIIVTEAEFGSTSKVGSLAIQWSGPTDWVEWRRSGRLHVAIEKGSVSRGIDQISGVILYDTELGLRWDVYGSREQKQVRFQGLSSLQRPLTDWLDASMVWDGALWQIKAHEVEPGHSFVSVCSAEGRECASVELTTLEAGWQIGVQSPWGKGEGTIDLGAAQQFQAHFEEGAWNLSSQCRLEHLCGDITYAFDAGWTLYRVRSRLLCYGDQIELYCPIWEQKGRFDVRAVGATWDFARLTGMMQEGQLSIDPSKSHLFNEPIQKGGVQWDHTGAIAHASLQTNLALTTLQMLANAPVGERKGLLTLNVEYSKDQKSSVSVEGIDVHWGEDSVPVLLHLIEEVDGAWSVKASAGPIAVQGTVLWADSALQFDRGRMTIGQMAEGQFHAVVKGSDDWEVHIDALQADVQRLANQWSLIDTAPSGAVSIAGTIFNKQGLEADLEIRCSTLQSGQYILENIGPMHLAYSSQTGAIVQGIDLSVQRFDLEGHVKAERLWYDAKLKSWLLSHAQIHVPAGFGIPLCDGAIDVTADIEAPFDAGAFSITVERGFIPCFGELRELAAFHLYRDADAIFVRTTFVHDHIKVPLEAALKNDGSGSLVMDRGLNITWDPGFYITMIEGSWAGIEASFHKEVNQEGMIGSCRFDGSKFPWNLPVSIGKGLECMGRLKLSMDDVQFQGIISGKQCELFGCQFKTVLSEVDIRPHLIRLYHCKLSDQAGIATLETLSIAKRETGEWVFSAPEITIKDFRPSLVQKIGEPPGALTPLVIRSAYFRAVHGV
ncbi:MAG: hypothetical protein RL235_560, partial [Chlamydiota bacterium]